MLLFYDGSIFFVKILKGIGKAPDSICPKGWRMVGYEGEINGKEKKSWINLFSKYYGGTHEDDDLLNIGTIIILPSFNLLYLGYYNPDYGKFDERTRHGMSWAIQAAWSTFAHAINFYPDWLSYQSGGSKGYGFSLR